MTCKFMHLALVALLFGIVAASPVGAADPVADQDKTVAIVNDVAIPQARLEVNLKAAEQQGKTDGPVLRKQIKDALIDLELFSQEASKQGLDQQPEVAQIIEITRQEILRNALAQDYIKKHPISEEQIKQAYESQKQALGNKEYKVAHILVDSEKAAKAILASLKKRGDFGTIAKTKSQDQASKAQGGELGWSNSAGFAQPFAEALVKLRKGQVSAPVKTEFGWHIIKLEGVRDRVMPPYDKVRAELQIRLQQMAIQEILNSLHAQAKIG
jgi:peptidyl-prolyl cis-trans isomerase C